MEVDLINEPRVQFKKKKKKMCNLNKQGSRIQVYNSVSRNIQETQRII